MAMTYLDTDGGKLAIEIDGASEAPVVISFPGLGLTRDSYGPVSTRLLAAGFSVARVDLRGHGDILAGNSLAAGAATIAAGCAHDKFVGPRLGNVGAVPALVVMGEKDPDLSDPPAEARWVASHSHDGAEVVLVPDVGHAPHLEEPDVVGPAMVAFLGSIRFGQQ